MTSSRDETRNLLKTFGIQADEAVIAHLARNSQIKALRIRISLEDLTDYGSQTPTGTLALEIEGQISKSE
jgi:hypothetical protein